MKVRLLAVTHRQPDWVVAGEREYGKRLPREWGFELVELKPAARPKGGPIDRARAQEKERIESELGKFARRPLVIALDERGKNWRTEDLVTRLQDWQHDGRDLAFVIGGADGFDRDFLGAADQRWALSAATLPHGLVRVIVVEQLYRAASVLAGHPYHRA